MYLKKPAALAVALGALLAAPPPLFAQETPESLSEAEREVLSEIEKDYQTYAEAAGQHQNRMRNILRREYQDRRQQIEERYAQQISDAERQERERRLAAIALLEKFIVDYPDHKRFTPDAMFRLADLYLDQANYEFEQNFSLEDFSAAPVDEGDPDAFAAPRADYSKSLTLWRDIITRFPDYRQRAGVLYLLAYYLNEIGETREALQVARGLVCANKWDPLAEPEPAPDKEIVRAMLGASTRAPFVDHYADCESISDEENLVDNAWARIVAEIHFTTPGELTHAISAYLRVVDNPESPFYAESLYKLAWSYYRNDDFLKGIQAFDDSIVLHDKLSAEGKEALDLRKESLEYIAISFTDPWSVDEQPDPVRSFDRAFNFYKDRLDEPHVRDVFVQLGDTFMLLEAFTQAADSYRIAIKNWPLHPQNPVVHQRIVNAYEQMGESDLAEQEARKLANSYKPGTEWFEANQTDREAMEAMEKIGERMLSAVAINTHRAAQQARKLYEADPTPENKQKYLALYKEASEHYERFLGQYPTSDNAYEYTYFLAETMFWSERYRESIPHYRWVRDHRDISEKYFEKAARSMVQAYDEEVKRAVAAGEITEPPTPTIEELREMPKPIKARPVPPLYADLRQAYDEYQQLVNDPQSAPMMGYEAALISYRHLDLDDAEARFKVTLDKFCGTDQAVKSKDALLAIYEATGEDEKFKKTNDDFINSECGTEEDIALARAQNRSKAFREAEDLFKDKKYNAASIAFYRFYKTAPPDDPNLPVALYNSAIAYERSGKPKTAVYLFKEFTGNPAPEFRDSEYYLPALYLTAVAYYKAFDYDNAVNTYLDVVKAADKAQKQPAGERTLEEIKLDSLYNAALLRELDRVYKDPRGEPGTGAASLYTRYAKLEKDRGKSGDAMWSIARMWRTAGNFGELERAYSTWRKTYGRDPGQANNYVFSFYDLAKLAEKSGRKSDTRKYKNETIKAWSAIGQPKATAAADMAAEFEFESAEDYYNGDFTKYRIRSAPKTKKEGERVLNKIDSLRDAAKAKYEALSKYESGPWGLAGTVRIGDLFYFSALKITEIPVPKEIERLDAKYPEKGYIFEYQDVINGLVKPLENQAKLQWEKVVDAGKAQKVSNEWTQLAQERLHDFVSADDFPVQRPARVEGTAEP